MQSKISNVFHEFIYKTGDNQFLNAVKITISAASAFIFLYNNHLGAFSFSVALGVMLTSIVDIDSSLKDKIKGLALAMVCTPLVTILFTLIYKYSWIFYIIFAVYVFFCSLISIYGQRANKFSFTLLLGLCLSFIHITNTTDLLHNALYMFLGGLYYAIISLIFYFLFPSRYINIEVSNSMDLMSKYLDKKSQVWTVGADINKLRSERLVLQISINDSFRSINEYLEKNKMSTLNSNHNRKVVITVSFLHEIMNLASSISFRNTQVTTRLANEHILDSMQKITSDLSQVLSDISISVKSNAKYISHYNLSEDLEVLKTKINAYNLKYPEDKAYLESTLVYIENQVEKITGLENIFLQGVQLNNTAANVTSLKKPIIKTSNYQLKTLVDNLNFKSINFKYSLRFAIAMIFGLFIGNLIQVEKPYWILLTILVIMRPGYGLTRSRAYSRVIGTVIGGFIGVLILFLIKDRYVLSCLAIGVMICSYWLISSDYKIGVTFLTLFIILVFGILNNNPTVSFLYRIADTILGSFIALIATNYLWPSWEINSIKNNLKLALTTTNQYVDELDEFYFQKNENLDHLALARKNAFINSSNLMSSYQRLVQEPKSKQENRSDYYEITILNQTLLGAILSLINLLNLNADYKVNSDALKQITLNLDKSVDNLDHAACVGVPQKQTQPIDNPSVTPVASSGNNDQLIQNQIVWIKNISEQIEKVSEKL